MAEIKSFKAMRFTEKAGNIKDLVCPPYDIISPEERVQFIETNENNVIRLEKPEGENAYESAGNLLNNWLESGILKCDEKDGIYIYEIEFDGIGGRKTVNGIICRVKLEEFSKGVVLPHEETLTKAKQDRFDLMKATKCNFSQVYSLYDDSNRTVTDVINQITSSTAPVNELTDKDGLVHRLWIIDDEATCKKICDDFKDRQLFIADGHHRYETGLNFRNYLHENCGAKEGDACDYIMMMLVDINHKGLDVWPTHRILYNLDNFDAKALLNKISDRFDVTCGLTREDAINRLEEAYKNNKIAFVMCSKSENGLCFDYIEYKFDAISEQKVNMNAASRELDVNVLHLELLSELGINKENMAQQKNLVYTKKIEEAVDAVSEDADCAFIINPTRVRQIFGVASCGEKMPQKSTYFYPKLITGMVMNRFED